MTQHGLPAGSRNHLPGVHLLGPLGIESSSLVMIIPRAQICVFYAAGSAGIAEVGNGRASSVFGCVLVVLAVTCGQVAALGGAGRSGGHGVLLVARPRAEVGHGDGCGCAGLPYR